MYANPSFHALVSIHCIWIKPLELGGGNVAPLDVGGTFLLPLEW